MFLISPNALKINNVSHILYEQGVGMVVKQQLENSSYDIQLNVSS